MFKQNRSVYIIAAALMALLFMQCMWLYYAIKQEKRFLHSGTRQAAIETLAEIEQKEDSKLIITSLDTLLRILPERSPKTIRKPETVKVVVSNTDHKRVIVRNNGKETVTSSFSYSDNGKTHSEIRIVESDVKTAGPELKRTKTKIKNYEQLLKKIIFQSRKENIKIEERLNFNELQKTLRSNLVARGINIMPELAVTDTTGKPFYHTTGYYSPGEITVPMFTKDIVVKNYNLHLLYPTTLNYLLKKSVTVVVLSFAVTLLLITVILLLYKKILTEQKLNKYKNDFINNLTHELKTPLATISLANSNISAAAGYSQQQNIKKYTAIINEENNKLSSHIEKVFELSLLEKEKQIFTIQPVSLHEVIEEAIQQNTSVINSAGAKFDFMPHAQFSTVAIDKFHFINVLNNLIDNAVKYNEGAIKIAITTQNISDRVILRIKDNGIGISKEHQKYIFDKFFRVMDKDLHTVKGFGVGLSYVKQAIELFKGSIEVNSEENNGSEFIISLPYVRS